MGFIIKMEQITDTNLYFQNYLKLLDLRLFTLLGFCPEENRGEAKDRIVLAVDPSAQPVRWAAEEEMLTCAGMVNELTAEQDALRTRAEETGELPRIDLLQQRFGLNADEMLLLTAILACNADEHFRRVYKLFRNSEEPRMDLLLSLIDTDGAPYSRAELLGTEGKLLSCGLVETVGAVSDPGPLTAYRPAPGLLSWLNGARSTDVFHGRAQWISESGAAGTAGTYESVRSAIEISENGSEPVPLVSLFGPDEERLMKAVKNLAAELNRPLLHLDLQGIAPGESLPLLRYALRDGVMNNGLVVLDGIDHWIDSGAVFPAEAGAVLEKWTAPVITLTNRSFVFTVGMMQERLVLRIPVKGLSGSQRFTVWQDRLAEQLLDGDFEEAELRTLAGQFTLNSAQIRSAVNYALGLAITENRELTIADLYAGARMSSMHHLSDLAKRMESRYTLKDLVLPEKQQREINALIAMARNRSLVLDDWGAGKKLVSGRGISALFTGVPGTGKTLSAQAIAGELGLDIYRVDLSTIISKYIGETEKNLERIFTEAQNSNVILFFDEADALFGRRSEVSDSHDRYANIEVGYLLQRIETYDGIVLMATNLGANLDEAFARRIHFIIDFPFPDEDTRLRLWQLLLPENIEKEAEIDLHPFAAAYKIAGGGIRNAVVWAIYESARLGRPLSREDLLHGVEREYQKMGKVFIPIR